MHYYDDINTLNAPDFLAAMPDGIAMAMGHKHGPSNPFGEYMQGSPLRIGAYAAGLLSGRGFVGESQTAVISRGLRTKEFADSLALSMQGLVRRRFDAQAQHRAFVSDVEVSRLGEPEPMGDIKFDSTFADVTTGGEYQVGRAVLSDGETLMLFSFGRIVDVSRETIINDDKELIAAAIGEVGVTAARHEARLVARALNDNGLMSDGSAVFHANYGNVVTDAFGETSFALALAALRNQTGSDGLALDCSAANLVVASDLEYSASKIVRESGLPIRMTAMSALPSGRYFVFASREVVRTVAVAGLSGAEHPLAVEAVKGAQNLDGLSLKVRLDVGANMIGRKGIIRGGL